MNKQRYEIDKEGFDRIINAILSIEINKLNVGQLFNVIQALTGIVKPIKEEDKKEE